VEGYFEYNLYLPNPFKAFNGCLLIVVLVSIGGDSLKQCCKDQFTSNKISVAPEQDRLGTLSLRWGTHTALRPTASHQHFLMLANLF